MVLRKRIRMLACIAALSVVIAGMPALRASAAYRSGVPVQAVITGQGSGNNGSGSGGNGGSGNKGSGKGSGSGSDASGQAGQDGAVIGDEAAPLARQVLDTMRHMWDKGSEIPVPYMALPGLLALAGIISLCLSFRKDPGEEDGDMPE